MQQVNEKLNQILSTLNQRFDNLEAKTTADIDNLRTDVDLVKKELKKSTNQLLRKNLIVIGLGNPETGEKVNLLEKFITICKEINIDIRKYDVERLIPINGNMTKVCLSSTILRNDILKNKKLLATTDLYKEIKIKEDFPADVRRTREKLFPYVKASKSQGLKVTYKQDKLLIEGQLFTLDMLESGRVKVKRQRSQEDSPEAEAEETIKDGAAEVKAIHPQTPRSSKKPDHKRAKGAFKGSHVRTNSLDRYIFKIVSEVNEEGKLNKNTENINRTEINSNGSEKI